MKTRKFIIGVIVLICLLASYCRLFFIPGNIITKSVSIQDKNLNVDNFSVENKPNVEIFISYHKPFLILSSDIFKPIQVGKSISSINLNINGDDVGDNISTKNPYFCELTATYWIWKNSKADYVGLFHYRRLLNLKSEELLNEYTASNDFLNNFNITKKDILDILSEYDIILPYKWNTGEYSLYEQYSKSHVISDLDCVLNIIQEKYGPKLYNLAQNVLKNNSEGYFGNILITSKKIFDEYASWLFDILFEVEKRIQSDVLERNTYQQRVYGFLSERLMTVFIAAHPELKVKELPVLFLKKEKKLDRFKKYIFFK